MSDISRPSWTCREVIDDSPEVFCEAFTVRPTLMHATFGATDAAEAAASLIDEAEQRECDIDCPCFRDGCSRLIEVCDGNSWRRFRVRCRIVAQYTAETT